MQGAIMLESGYFTGNAIHNPLEFRRSLKMSKELFMKIFIGVQEYDDYFRHRKDRSGLPRFTSVQKCTATLRCIAYGAPPNTVNDYLHMGKSNDQDTVYKFS
jgi:hypothetical protein